VFLLALLKVILALLKAFVNAQKNMKIISQNTAQGHAGTVK